MPHYTLTVGLDNIEAAIAELEQQALQHIERAVSDVADQVLSDWQDAVMKARGIWQPVRESYVKSIRIEHPTPYSAVVITSLKIADEIETGQPARDLKRMLDSSPKVREGKRGRYLVIPFRHNTPGNSALAPAMPKQVHQKAKYLSLSTIAGTGTRPSGTGAYDIGTRKRLTVPKSTYQWGGALPAGAAPKLKPSHTTDPYAGMRRFDTSTGKAKSSSYLTFRIMGAWQTGAWTVAAKPGLYIAQGVQREVETKLRTALADRR